jgi:hypothetical protein
MTADDAQPSRQALAVAGRSEPLKVTGKLRVAIETMVWAGACRADAAKAAGLKDRSLKSAFRKSHVKAFYLRELDVLRTSERARNIHAFVDVRDNSENSMARVQAAKALEQVSETEGMRGHSPNLTPGLTIQIINTTDAPRTVSPVIDVTPTPDHDRDAI